MNLFSDVHSHSIKLLKTPQLHSDWCAIEAGLKALLKENGLDVCSAFVLQDLRKKLNDAAKSGSDLPIKEKAKEILRACNVQKTGFQDRAALIKQFRHFYLVSEKGSQYVWVMDHPKSLGQWSYDAFAGKPQPLLSIFLATENEVFGSANRKMLAEALQLARKWSADAEILLGAKADSTMDLLRKWFCAGEVTEQNLENIRLILLNGFKKITAACNSGQIIFSDRPHLRVSGDYDTTYASVNAGDSLPVIYIYELFLTTGKRNATGSIPKMWLCVVTILHELSHRLLKTVDHRYDYQGLLPSPSFNSTKALTNADSWAYFCADLLGYIPQATRQSVLS